MAGTSLGLRPPAGEALITAALTVLVAAAAILVVVGPPVIVLGGLFALLAVLAGCWRFGREAPLLAVITFAPLIPIAEGGSFSSLGAYGSDVRALLIAVGTSLYLLAYVRGTPALPRPLRGPVVALLALAAIGLPVGILNSDDATELIAELSKGIGQPLFFAAFVIAVSAALRDRAGARERILAAFALAVLAQALIVVAEFATGAAFDAERGILRAQGTVGANFLGAMSMLGVFTGLSLRSGSLNPLMVRLGGATVLASGGILALALTRGALIGVVIGVGYVVLTGLDARGRRIAVRAAVATLAVIVLVPPISALWTSRLDEQGLAGFDRQATWVSGVRMGLDDPLTGLGTLGVTEGIAENRDYSHTPVGNTNVVPHNIWVLSFAEGGLAALVATLAFSLLALVAVLNRPRRGSPADRFLVAGLLGFAVVVMINNLFTHPEVMIPTLALLAIVCGPAAAARETRAAA